MELRLNRLRVELGIPVKWKLMMDVIKVILTKIIRCFTIEELEKMKDTNDDLIINVELT